MKQFGCSAVTTPALFISKSIDPSLNKTGCNGADGMAAVEAWSDECILEERSMLGGLITA
jgi:hypothetical protein